MTALLLTRSPEKATAAILTVRHESYLEDVTVHLTMQELIDLEGACAAVRLQLEVGDAPKSTKSDADKQPKRPKNMQEFFAQFGLDYEKETRELLAELAPVTSVNGRIGDVLISEIASPVFVGTPTGTPFVSPEEIGKLVDGITHNGFRDCGRVARRALEECVELCLACGASASEIMGSVADALHNEALKASVSRENESVTVFPSQLRPLQSGSEYVTQEIADVHLVLADLMYLASISEQALAIAERAKFNRLSSPEAKFATDGHTFYLKKSHIKDGTPST